MTDSSHSSDLDTTARRYRALGDPSRLRIVEVLREASDPLSVAMLAKRVELHVNTVRTHVRVLSEAGLVSSAREDAPHEGRPSVVYRLEPDPELAGSLPAGDDYRLLAEMLASYVGGSELESNEDLRETGRAWGRYLVKRATPLRTVTPKEATNELVRLNARLGFQPELTGEEPTGEQGGCRQLLLHRCPFVELARNYPGVVCPMHLGLMQGALAELDAGVAVTELKPLVEPTVCVAELATAGS